MNSTKKRILSIWLPDWPLLRQTLDRSEQFDGAGTQPYRQQAIVLHQMVRGSKRVAACSAKARSLGITVGMPFSEAAALLGGVSPVSRGPGGPGQGCQAATSRRGVLVAWPHDPFADREALERLALWCHRYSPLVGLEDGSEPDGLLLDVTGVARFFGGEEALARQILARFARRNIVIRLGLAATVGAAWAAARYGPYGMPVPGPGGNRPGREAHLSPAGAAGFQAILAGDGSSAVIVAPEQGGEFLAALPLAALRLPLEVLDLLGQLGLQSVSELQALPRADFNTRFGPELLRRWDQAAGRLEEPIRALPLPQKFEAEQFFEHPVSDRATLEVVVRQLVERVAQMAAMAGRGALRAEVSFDCKSCGKACFEVGLFHPSASADHLFGLVQMRLERCQLPGPVEMAGVRITATAALERRQAELFESGVASEPAGQLAKLIDRLASRLGRDRIVGVGLLAEAQPEKAYRYRSLVGVRRSSCRRLPARDLPPRPLQLLPRPRRLKAVAIVPDGPPLQFLMPAGQQCVNRAWGPERIQTGWWRGEPVHRDYYRVETPSGSRYWLFRRCSDGKWFLHGVFV
ncbi:MAG: Y-family DNA polymerase [Thermoguttaceae bacterium]